MTADAGRCVTGTRLRCCIWAADQRLSKYNGLPPTSHLLNHDQQSSAETGCRDARIKLFTLEYSWVSDRVLDIYSSVCTTGVLATTAGLTIRAPHTNVRRGRAFLIRVARIFSGGTHFSPPQKKKLTTFLVVVTFKTRNWWFLNVRLNIKTAC